ncbi:MAG: nucleotide sugar dehydrogenase [Candidatus Thermoplasmatota archaeon]
MNIVELEASLKNHEKKLGVWGCGYIGFSTMVAFANEGISVIGYDINKNVVRAINNKEHLIKDIDIFFGMKYSELISEGLIKATYNVEDMYEKRIFADFIAVPTEKDGKPHVDPLKDVLGNLRKIYKKRKGTIFIESTLYPSCTNELIIPYMEKDGLKLDKDYYLVVAPRRDWFTVGEGKTLKNLPRIFAGASKKSAEIGKNVLSLICSNLLNAESCENAEVVKAVENAIRMVDIALCYQLTIAFPNLDMRKIFELAGTKWNVNTYYPNIKCGGYCLPLAPEYLILGAKLPKALTILKSAIETNEKMPSLIVKKLQDYNKIGILGLSYKENIKVHQLSGSLALVEKLKDKEIKINDPLYTDEEIENIAGRKAFKFPDELDNFDAIVLATPHDYYKRIKKSVIVKKLSKVKFIFDAHGFWKKLKLPKSCVYKILGSANWLEKKYW